MRAIVAGVLLVFAGVTVPAILLNTQIGSGVAADAIQFHLPQINYFIAHPGNLLGYPGYAPTLPGYHWLMALIANLTGQQTVGNASIVLRLVHWALCASGLMLALLLAHRLSRDASSASWIIPMLPLMASWFSVQAAVYFGTDLVALALFVVMLAALQPQRAPAYVAAPALVFVRHMFAPVMLTPAVQALLGAPRNDLAKAFLRTAALAALPTVVILIYVVAWRGLVPPGTASQMNRGGVFPQAWVHALAYLGLVAFIFAPLDARKLAPFLRDREGRVLTLAMLAIALLLWLVAPSNYDMNQGRWGSVLWSLARHAPVFGPRSSAMLALSLPGAVFVAFLIWRGRRYGQFPPELAALALYVAGLALTNATYQRYIEPPAFLCLGLFFARVAVESSRTARLWTALVAAVYLGTSALRLY